MKWTERLPIWLSFQFTGILDYFFVSPLRCEVYDERYFCLRFLTAPSAHKHHHAAAAPYRHSPTASFAA